MTKIVLNILFLLLSTIAISQPGGGGGVTIKHVYDSSGKEIDVQNSEEYSLACYLLNDTVFLSKSVYSKLDNCFETFQVDSSGYVLDYRDTSRKIPANFYVQYKYKAIRMNPLNSIELRASAAYDNFRIMLSTAEDTMIVDFIKVIGENGHGIGHVIDSLVFAPGYYQYKKRRVFPISYPKDMLWDKDSLILESYSHLVSDEKRFLLEYQLLRLNQEIEELEIRRKELEESDMWKTFDEENRKYFFSEFKRQMATLKWHRNKLLSEKAKESKKD